MTDTLLPPLFCSPRPPWIQRCISGAVLIGLCAAVTLSMAAGRKGSKPRSKPPAPIEAVQLYEDRAEAMQFARELDTQEGWTDGWAARWVAQAQHMPAVVRLSRAAASPTQKNWYVYRERFIEPKRIQAGAQFWLENREALDRAQATYGVPPWLVVGIIGVETLYGTHTGKYRALDALTTLAFDFPADHPRAQQRSAFFKAELTELLRLAKRTQTSADQWIGSYAGAMGLPQFMPSNWNTLAVDFDEDGRIDLLGSPSDAIGSVARYLKHHGWMAGMPTHYAIRLDPDKLDMPTLMAPDILPTFTPERFEALGVRLPDEAQQHPGPLALVELINGDPVNGGSPPTYVAGTQNFYTITRYNWSSYYAMAVIELGHSVQAALEGSTAP